MAEKLDPRQVTSVEELLRTWRQTLRVDLGQIGIVLFLLGVLLLGLSVSFRESEEEATVRLASLRRRILMGYRVRIRRWMLWSGLILMALGALLQW